MVPFISSKDVERHWIPLELFPSWFPRSPLEILLVLDLWYSCTCTIRSGFLREFDVILFFSCGALNGM